MAMRTVSQRRRFSTTRSDIATSRKATYRREEPAPPKGWRASFRLGKLIARERDRKDGDGMTIRKMWVLATMAAVACDPSGRVGPPDREANIPDDIGSTIDIEGDPPLPTIVPDDAVEGQMERWAAGDGFSCRIDDTSALSCWGRDDVGQATPPGGSYQAVSAAAASACALTTDGEVACWGDALEGAPTTAGFVGVDISDSTACAWDNEGALTCWGSVDPGKEGRGVAVAVGPDQVCAADSFGVVTCWGDVAVPPPSDLSAAALAAGDRHVCAIDLDGRLSCWGNNAAGQTNAPDGLWRFVSAYGDATCAVDFAGELSCWGSGSGGALDVPDSDGFVGFTLGNDHGCASDLSGRDACWGSNDVTQASVLPDEVLDVAVAAGTLCWLDGEGQADCGGANAFGMATPPAMSGMTSIALGTDYGCATGPTETVCWGGDTAGDTTQVDGAPAGPLDVVRNGDNVTCGQQTDGRVTCWGAAYGPQSPATLSLPADAVSTFDVGNFHGCAILEASGAMACWGANDIGQATAQPGSYQAISTGPLANCAVASDGELVCFGFENAPFITPPMGTYTGVVVSRFHACATATDGATTCWGVAAELGSGPPADVVFAKLEADVGQTCGLTDAGKVRCFGAFAR